MEIAITAIGTANPPYKKSQQEAAELIAEMLHLKPSEKRFLKSIYAATGIEYRHSVLADYCRPREEFEFFPNKVDALFPSTAKRMEIYKKHAIEIALAAIKNCFACADIQKKTITHVITVSCTGMYAPGIDIEIIQKLNLSTNIKRTAVNFMGCYGAFNAIKLADAICRADGNAKVLVVCVELCTIHFQKSNHLSDMVANAIFADGAAAIIVEKAHSQTNKCFTLKSFYCDLLPRSHDEMAWTIADSGFDMVLSAYVPELIQSGIFSFVEKLLASYQLKLEQIDFFAIHPGALKILRACEEALQISPTANRYAYQVLRNFGNMSSATILFVLKEIWEDIQQLDHQKNIFSCAFGPGLTLESMLLETHCV